MEDVIIITNPMIAVNESAKVTLSKFLRVIEPCCRNLQVLGGNLRIEGDLKQVQLVSVPIKRSPNKMKRLFDLVWLQLKMSELVMQHVQEGMQVFFWIGDKMLLPYFCVKYKKAEINYFIYGNPQKEGKKGFFSKISAFLIRIMAENADYICMESPSVEHEWKGLKIDRKRIIHLYTEVMPMTPIVERKRVIGMVCRLTAGKHVLESIQAFSEIHKDFPDWRLEIVGSGVQETECRNLIRKLNLDGSVVLYGWIDHAQLRSVTKRWKFLLFPSDTEGMPNGVIEMMAQGIPPIASPVGGICDVVEVNKTGWVIDACSVHGIQSALKQALRSECYESVSEEAQRVIALKYVLEAAQIDAKIQMLR